MKDDLDPLWLVALAVLGWLLWDRFGKQSTSRGGRPRGPAAELPHSNADEEKGRVLAYAGCMAATEGAGGSLCAQISNLGPVKQIGKDFVQAWESTWDSDCHYRINDGCISEHDYCVGGRGSFPGLLALTADQVALVPEQVRPDCGPYEAEARQKGIIR